MQGRFAFAAAQHLQRDGRKNRHRQQDGSGHQNKMGANRSQRSFWAVMRWNRAM
ncbi:MAG: hypothetical protein I8H91_11665 [Burkholderiales bacterium]|nr:hypothetical protein [Burkholderiales bacterium]